MQVALIVPYYDPDGSRLNAFDFVWIKLQELYSWDKSIIAPGVRHGVFNRGRARNQGVRSAENHKADVVVICDADSYPERDPLMRAIIGAANDGKVHFPMTRIHQLNQQGITAYTYGPSAGGCWVATPETWFELGGQDERGGYSADDRPMLEIMEAFGKGPVYHEGVMKCLWHSGEHRTVPKATTDLIQEYLDLNRDPVAARKYLDDNQVARLG